ncbi:MAG: carbohydrate-binding domain-containing protein, partial [Coriobacteriales bacterium]
MTFKKTGISGRIAASACAAALAGSMCAAGCSGSGADSVSSGQAASFSLEALDLGYTDRDKDPSYSEEEAELIDLNTAGSTVEITEEGTYILRGTAQDTQLLVECQDEQAKVQLVLDGASISCSTGPAVYVKAADKCFVTLAAGSENSLSDGDGYTLSDDDGSEEPTAALFSKADLTLQGSGSLEVCGNTKHAVCSKDELVVTGGSYTISSAEDGLRGKDCVKVLDGSFEISAGEDAVKSNEVADATRGFVLIDGGSWQVEAGDDAFHAETALIVNGGDIEVSTCVEGYEGMQVYINGGDTSITASDDAINASSGSSASTEGAGGGAPGGGDAAQAASGGEPPSKPEGSGEGDAQPQQARGDRPSRSEDSVNSGQRGGGMGSAGGGGGMDVDESCLVQINGGSVTLDAEGDGIDSNGALEITGGTVVVYGPTGSGNGALDYGSTATVTGGTVIALGSSGMAQSFSSGDQAFALVSASGIAGSKVAVTDGSGVVLAQTTSAKSFQCALVSAPGMTSGQTYTLTVSGTSTEFTAGTNGS